MSCDVRSCDVPCNGHVVCSKWFCDDVVIQSTILYYKVLLCTTQYYSSTTKYYSSTTLYYTVLQRTTPVLLCTTKQHSRLILDKNEPLFTLRGATGVILQLHQKLHLPRKMTVMSHMKRHLQCAEQQESHDNFTKYCACHAK